MSISPYLEKKILDTMLVDVYLSLHSADPGKSGASEIAGGSYARRPIIWDEVNGGLKTNHDNIEFMGMPSIRVSHIAIWEAPRGGNYLWGGALIDPKIVNAGDTFRIVSGSLRITLSEPQ